MCPRGSVPRSTDSYGPKYPMLLPGQMRTFAASATGFSRASIAITSSTW
jgi:hypothetical protein